MMMSNINSLCLNARLARAIEANTKPSQMMIGAENSISAPRTLSRTNKIARLVHNYTAALIYRLILFKSSPELPH